MKTKILIIEDEKIINEMYSMKFKKEWFEVESSLDWLEWLSKVTEFKPDVILLDIMTPGMNWFETLEVLKNQSSSNSKIVMFTNIVDKEKIDKAMEMWADDYLIKANTTPKTAVEKVKNLLSESKDNTKKIENIDIYLNTWINNFKIKNPDGWKDIDIQISINV